ncbi:Stress-associated endoplasmic reticulum protein 1 [Frankliniella fusca]|uniref:Stress-associated endoplasmic reticulum protein 1 n=1 Tax=Frankliniella fusca TaxID=407009 RepID=A0AAE1LHF0_9NEOP|nr:Stress-associated endoplasmic reticulum protein 1 [Frankliniella fusca]
MKKMLMRIFILTCGPQEEDAKLGMVKYLSEHGLNDLRETIFFMLKKLISNEYAINFNLTGVNRKGVHTAKKKFDDTLPCIVLKAAVKQHSRTLAMRGDDARHKYNSSEFRSAVSDWLKDAKKRADNDRQRELRRQRQGEESGED